jgi:pimeloyl-ACP methyl ester carboxylesterase
MMGSNGQHVILLHGLWFNHYVMILLARRIRKAGFQPHYFSYPTTTMTPVENARRLHEFVESLSLETPVHFVAHSLGGLVVINHLLQYSDYPIGRIVLLGSPVLGSENARRLQQIPFGKKMLGFSTEQNGLLHGAAVPENILREGGHEIGMIAGTLGFGMGTFIRGAVGSQNIPHDGAVDVAETQMPGLSDHICIRASHSGLLVSSRAAGQVVYFLKNGRFQSME